MSAFTESALLKKLSELNCSQQSIQTLSLWLIHHRKHYISIVKTWYREIQNVSESHKLTFMYLANDVIQNSKKKGPEYGIEFANVLPKIFSHIGDTCKSPKLVSSLERILKIWLERGVYDTNTIEEFRCKLLKENMISIGGTTSGSESYSPEDDEISLKRSSDGETAINTKPKKTRVSPKEDVVFEMINNTELNGNGTEQSPNLPTDEAPESEDLIKCLVRIENSASSDAAVRERIANLPPEISEISCLNKLDDKESAKQLADQVNEAVELLNDYNARLASEMDERIKLAAMLRNYLAEQKELLIQAEKRLDEYKRKLQRMLAVQREIRDHLSNLPDLKSLPDVTGGLAPLPSAGDLFSIH